MRKLDAALDKSRRSRSTMPTRENTAAFIEVNDVARLDLALQNPSDSPY